MASSSSSTEYLPSSLTFLIANFQSFITIKLDSTNYFVWKTQVETALRANSLLEYATGSVDIPPVETLDLSGNKIPNPEYVKWDTVDRMLLSCLIATLTPSILPHIVGARHVHEVWSKLEENFSSLSRTHVMDLKRRLYSLKKTIPMEQYLDNIKSLLQKLEAAGSHIEDEDVVFHTLNGLPEEVYRTFKQAIRTRAEGTPLTFWALYSMLMAEDLCQDSIDTTNILLAHHTTAPALSQPVSVHPTPRPISTSTTSHNNPAQGFQFPVQFGQQGPQYNQNFNQMGHGGSQPGYSGSGGTRGYKGNKTRCQICGKTNHQANKCYYRQDLSYRPPSSQFGQGSSSSQFGSGPPTYYDVSGPSPYYGYAPAPAHFTPRPQAFMVNTENLGLYSVPQGSMPLQAYSAPPNYMPSSTMLHPSYHQQSHPGYSQQPMTSPNHMGSVVASSGISSSQPPWYFDTGATAHVTNDATHISQPTYTAPNVVTVGNGQTVPVSTSGHDYQSGSTSGPLPPGPLSPSAFF